MKRCMVMGVQMNQALIASGTNASDLGELRVSHEIGLLFTRAKRTLASSVNIRRYGAVPEYTLLV